MTPLTLDAIRPCLEGAIPAAVATSSMDGTPNVTLISQVHYMNPHHVALSYQFFNKTRENILANPRAAALVIHPETGLQYQLDLQYLRTETQGPLFENMKAKLAGIASHTGMSGVFRLRGSDVFRVLHIWEVPGASLPASPPKRNLLSALRTCSERMSETSDLSMLLENAMTCLESEFDIHHSMVLMLDGSGRRLYTVASRGYRQSGVGSEIAMGCGVIGVSAEQHAPIRITHMTSEYSYGRAIRDSVAREGHFGKLETAIPLPGLADSRSQMAAPIVFGKQLLGVLYVESPEDLRFTYDDEDALVSVAAQLGSAIHAMQQAAETHEAPALPDASKTTVDGTPSLIRHYVADDSIFIDDDYLIKGVAGAIFSKLLNDYASKQRTEFTNRELRLDSSLGLPDITDNLEARLILLQQRLSERNASMRIEKTGRGRFRLRVDRPFTVNVVR